MRVAYPAFLLLLGALPWVWRAARTSAQAFDRGAIVWRLVIVTLVVLSLAGLEIRLRDAPLAVVFAIDRSDSIPSAEQSHALERVNALAAAMRPADRAGVVVFGADAVLERRVADRVRLAGISSQLSPTATNIEAAIAAARAALPRDGLRRIVLLSDGRETAGDATREATMAAERGIRIDVIPAGVGNRGELAPTATRVVAPATVRLAEPFAVSVELEGAPGERGQLTVDREGQPSLTSEIVIGADGNASFTLADQRRQSGVYIYRARVAPSSEGNTAREDPASVAEAGAAVAVIGEPQVLYVTSSQNLLGTPLGAAGFRVQTVRPADVPVAAAALVAYDAILLDDIPVEQLTTGQAAALARYVEQLGGGLLVLGSSRSLSAAGYSTGPLGPLMPIDLRPRAGRRAPSMAFVVLYDKSGSMADLADGIPKIELARQAVMKVLDVIPPTDALGVIAFDASPVVVAPFEAGHDVRTIADRLRAVQSGGATAIAPAVEMAVAWLRGSLGSTATRRQAVLISDGRTSPADVQRVRAALAGQGIELSIVATGSAADRPLLQHLAQSTRGRAYFPEDVRDLPLIVAREVARSAGGRVVEEPFVVRSTPHAVLAGIDRASLPQLGGYVVSAARPGSDTILLSHLGDPVLAGWRAGLGKVAVFTADLGSSWSAPLREWRGFGSLWSQTVRWLSRRVHDRGLHAGMTESERGARLTIDAEDPDGRFLNGLETQATVRGPDGATRQLVLHAVAPGRYQVDVLMTARGPYVIAVTARAPDGTEQRLLRGFYWSADRERRARGADMSALTGLARLTDGKVLGELDNPFTEARPAEFRRVSQWLAAAALIFFFAEAVGLRGFGRRAAAAWGRRLGRGSSAGDTRAA